VETGSANLIETYIARQGVPNMTDYSDCYGCGYLKSVKAEDFNKAVEVFKENMLHTELKDWELKNPYLVRDILNYQQKKICNYFNILEQAENAASARYGAAQELKKLKERSGVHD